MSRFESHLEFVLAREGKLAAHGADRGGLTNYGITQLTYDAYRKRKSLPTRPVTEMSQGEMRDIYHEIWVSCGADRLPDPIDLVVFDAAVHSGAGRSVRWLQKLVGSKQDGAMGPRTLECLAEHVEVAGPVSVARDLIGIREAFIDDLIERDPSQVVFRRGWNNRLALLRSAVSEVV